MNMIADINFVIALFLSLYVFLLVFAKYSTLGSDKFNLFVTLSIVIHHKKWPCLLSFATTSSLLILFKLFECNEFLEWMSLFIYVIYKVIQVNQSGARSS